MLDKIRKTIKNKLFLPFMVAAGIFGASCGSRNFNPLASDAPPLESTLNAVQITAKDSAGQAEAGANYFVLPADYDFVSNTGTFPEPQAIANGQSDANGNIYVERNTPFNLVIEKDGRIQAMLNVPPNAESGMVSTLGFNVTNSLEAELPDSVSGDLLVNAHLRFKNKYAGDLVYVPGDFVMLDLGAKNKIGSVGEVTYLVKEKNGPILYSGAIASRDASEKLVVPENSTASRFIEVPVPPGYEGKFIQIWASLDGVTEHKLAGNVKVDPDTTGTDPQSTVDSLETYVDQSEEIPYNLAASDKAQDGTARKLESIISSDTSSLTVEYDEEYFSSWTPTGDEPVTVTYATSGNREFALKMTDGNGNSSDVHGNSGVKVIPVQVYEKDGIDQASGFFQIAKDELQSHGIINLSIRYSYILNKGGVQCKVDVYCAGEKIGFTYRSKQRDLAGADELDINDTEDALLTGMNVNPLDGGEPFISNIHPNSATGIAQQIHIQLLKCGYDYI